MMLVEKSLAVMKTAVLIFIQQERALRKAKRMDEILFLIEACVKSLNKEAIFKQKMREFYISEVMFYNIRKTIIDSESLDNKKGPKMTEKPKSKQTTMSVNDSLSIFGSNSIISLSKDHLGNLQPNYFSKGGIGRKSKFSSAFNRRNFERNKSIIHTDESTSPEKNFKSSVKEINIVATENAEMMEVLDFLDKERAQGVLDFEQIRRPKKGTEYFFGLFKKKQFKEDSFEHVYQEESGGFENLSGGPKKKLKRKKLEERMSTFKYEKEVQILKNRPLDISQENKEIEDVNFLKFFFEVSNSQMLEQMERFLANYLTISQNQRISFKKSTIRRRSLQSVLSMLRKSELRKNNNFLSDSDNERFGNSPMKCEPFLRKTDFNKFTNKLKRRRNRFKRNSNKEQKKRVSRSLSFSNHDQDFLR